MKFPKPYTLKQIAEILTCEFVGSKDLPVLGMNEIHVVDTGDIVFVDHPKYYQTALTSKAAVVLIDKQVACPEGKALLISDDPFRDFNTLAERFKPFVRSDKQISHTALIGKHTTIQPNCFIGHHVVIGHHCTIHPNVTLCNDTVIGNHVVIGPGSVLGSDAFYYKNRPRGFDQLKSCGRVVIEDHVHIGAGCTIDKGVTGNTTLREGTKLDNQIQIGHDTVIGKKCLIASQVGIAGCVIVEDEVTIWGQAGITSGITIGKKAVILAKSGVTKSLDGEKRYFGAPAEDIRYKYKERALVKSISEGLKNQNKINETP